MTRTLETATFAAAMLALLAACPDDGPAASAADAVGDAKGGDPVAPDAVFAFGTDPAQPISSAPFPSDLYLGSGVVQIAALQDDPIAGQAAKPELLARWSELANGRTGFGFASAVFLFTAAPVDVASLDGRVTLIGLGGDDAGREVRPQVFDSPHASAIGVRPTWGDYLVPGSTYGLLVRRGATTADGTEIEAPPAFAAVLGEADAPDHAAARAAFAPLRQYLADSGGDPADYVIGTVFTTEDSRPLGQRLAATVDAFAVQDPTRRVRWDEAAQDYVVAEPVEQAGLDAYFGVTAAPHEFNPGLWWDEGRNIAEQTDGAPYAGGTGHFGFGRVLNGSIEAPAISFVVEGGELVPSGSREEGDGLAAPLTTMIPFTLVLCEEHLADPSNLPVAMFSHGGTATRRDANAFANANCRSGVATIAIDMMSHGGRIALALKEAEGLIVPVRQDDRNTYTTLTRDDPGFVPDHIGDNGGAADTVVPWFAVQRGLDPAILEANLLQPTVDTLTLYRTLAEADWSGVQAGLSFDATRIFHQSISFGSSFHSAFLSLARGLRGVVTSVGSGHMISASIPMSPSNATEAGVIMAITLGTQSNAGELQSRAWADLGVNLLQWLGQRGDPLAWAPFVMRHRTDGEALAITSTSSSWDETLMSPAQFSWINAMGFEVLSDDGAWAVDPTVPGADMLAARTTTGPVSDNVAYGGVTHTAGVYVFGDACHGVIVGALCRQAYQPPFPPNVKRDTPRGFPSPLCAVHHAVRTFTDSLLAADGAAEIVAPDGSCEALYGTP